ncbi:hypothetical protein J2Y03_002405 [Neobacillus niacini]|nr:hypothetical protein [Neobacillus niacini]
MKNFIPNRTIEYNDNRKSKFIAQYGKCAVTGTELGKSDWHCHHKIPFHISKELKTIIRKITFFESDINSHNGW